MSATLQSVPTTRKPVEVPPAQRALYPRNQWYVAAQRDEVGRTLLNRRLLGEEVVLYRTQDGRAVALSDWCPHRSYRLSRSRLIGDVIQCGYHGICFDDTGACVKVPSQKATPKEMNVRRFPLVERYFWCWIWVGDADKADPALIPNLDDLVREDYFAALTPFHLINANFQLLLDNLADNTHASFLHPGFLDNANSTELMDKPYHVEVKGNIVEATQVFENFTPADGLATFFGLEKNKPVRRVRISREFEPSIHTSDDIYYDVNDTSRVLGRRVTFVAVTPAGDTSAHIGGAVLTTTDTRELIHKAGRAALDEDIVALEFAQTALEDCGPHFKEVNVAADRASILGRRVVAELVAAETN